MYPLNDFASGQYWLRIGQAANNNWFYSGVFNFNGTGTARPVCKFWKNIYAKEA